MHGRDIRFLYGIQFLQSETGDPAPDPETEENYEITRRIWNTMRQLEYTYNVTFSSPVMARREILPTLTSTVQAGDPIADFVFLEGSWVFTALMGGLLMEAAVYAASTSDLWAENRFLMPAVVFDDQVWSFHTARPRHERTGLGVNLDILYARGAENPVDLYEQGLWTWDAFREIMYLSTRDGDGIIGDAATIITHLIASNDGVMVDEYRNYGFAHPHTMAALEFVYEIFDAGWFNTRPGENWASGTTAFFSRSTPHMGRGGIFLCTCRYSLPCRPRQYTGLYQHGRLSTRPCHARGRGNARISV
jgi:hypothetical protein